MGIGGIVFQRRDRNLQKCYEIQGKVKVTNLILGNFQNLLTRGCFHQNKAQKASLWFWTWAIAFFEN